MAGCTTDCARHFAEALGLLAHADREDTAPLDKALAELQNLALLRHRCVDELASLGRVEQELGSKTALRQLCLRRAAPGWRVKGLGQALLAAIKADAGLRRRTKVPCSTPSVGPATAASVLAAMPEFGVAPCADGSGQHEGRHQVRAAPRYVT